MRYLTLFLAVMLSTAVLDVVVDSYRTWRHGVRREIATLRRRADDLEWGLARDTETFDACRRWTLFGRALCVLAGFIWCLAGGSE